MLETLLKNEILDFIEQYIHNNFYIDPIQSALRSIYGVYPCFIRYFSSIVIYKEPTRPEFIITINDNSELFFHHRPRGREAGEIPHHISHPNSLVELDEILEEVLGNVRRI